jgi:hypothetical protein
MTRKKNAKKTITTLLYLFFSSTKARDVINVIAGRTGNIYLLIFPEERDKKKNIHANHIKKYLMLPSVLMLLNVK